METKIKLEKFRTYEVNKLIEAGYKFARLASNRKFDKNALTAKKKSLKSKGLLQPAIVVPAQWAIDEGLEVIDFVTEEPLEPNEVDMSLAFTDANHRYKAHLALKAEKSKEYDGKFYVMLPLTDKDKISVADMLAEMNICTKVWSGTDYIRGAYMSHPELATDLLKYIVELEKRGFSLPAISKYATFSDGINKKVLTDFMQGIVAPILENSKKVEQNIATSRKLLEAAKTFDTKFLAPRTFPDWIINQYTTSDENETRSDVTNRLVAFLSSLSKEQTDDIGSTKGEKGGDSKETAIFNKLNMLYSKFSEHYQK